MCSDIKIIFSIFPLLIFIQSSCSAVRNLDVLENQECGIRLDLPDFEEEKSYEEEESVSFSGPSIMNAVLDSATGDMVATDIIKASKVTARFKNAAERKGRVSLIFDVTVPPVLIDSECQLTLLPLADIGGDSLYLDPVYITGQKYREAQMRGYEKYRALLSTIISDSTDFIMMRSLEMFIRRYFPETYLMKNDSSLVSESDAENIFGVRQKDALEHYKRYGLMERNRRRKENSEKMYSKIISNGVDKIRLDTVVVSQGGEVTYRYIQDLDCKQSVKKIPVSLFGELYVYGKKVCTLPSPEKIVFYISSLTSLADTSARYTVRVIERQVNESLNAVIDFEIGSSEVDLTLGNNAVELARVSSWAGKVLEKAGYETDSVIVTASCSPEGRYAYNTELSKGRAEAVKEHLAAITRVGKSIFRTAYLPENWETLKKIIVSDSCVSYSTKQYVMSLDNERNPDKAELKLKSIPEYQYIQREVYPKLRNVRFDIYLRRKGMLKDTVHTKDVDSLYMSGLKALLKADYKKAVSVLGNYGDYNSALAYLAAGYNEKALAVLSEIDSVSARVEYLTAMALYRLGKKKSGYSYFISSVRKDPAMLHRSRLDPELGDAVRRYERENN